MPNFYQQKFSITCYKNFNFATQEQDLLKHPNIISKFDVNIKNLKFTRIFIYRKFCKQNINTKKFKILSDKIR